MVIVALQASAKDHHHGAGLVPADLWDRGELSVPGQCQGGDAHAAELPQLHPAAARLHDHARHPQRSENLHVTRFPCSCHHRDHEHVSFVDLHRRQEHRADSKNKGVEIFADGSG